MFYLKDKNGNFIQMNGTFYAKCPRCEKLHPVDLADLVRMDRDFDLSGTMVYCGECTEKLMGQAVERRYP